MTGYLQRLLNRSQPASAPTASPGGDASLARPAMPSRSPVAAADQRLHDPALASLIGMTPPGQPSDPDSPAPEARFEAAAHRDFAGLQPFTERDAIAPANRQARRPEERPLPTPATREAAPTDGPAAPLSTSTETSETAQSTAPEADSVEMQPAPAPVEHPLRRLDIDYPQPPAEAPLQPTSPAPPTPGPLPETARPAVPEFRPVKERGPDIQNRPVPESTQPSASAASPPHPAERQQASIAAEAPHTVEPPPLPAPPPPPSPEPETIIIEKTEPAPQVVRTERPAPEAKPPEPVERPRPRPKTAAAASLIGPLPQRMRVRTLFGVRRR